MASGKVKWFDNTKGFGFITESTGHEVFVHFTAIASDGYRTLVEGEDVSFEMISSERGWKADKVQRLNPPPPRQTHHRPSSHSGRQPHPFDAQSGHPDSRSRL